jgi:hypothetical protein
MQSRSQWPRGLRHRSAAARLLKLWVRILPGAWMFVCCECCVLSGRGLCDELITLPEESHRVWCVVVCDLETLWMRRPWPTGGCRNKNKQNKQETKKSSLKCLLAHETDAKTKHLGFRRACNRQIYERICLNNERIFSCHAFGGRLFIKYTFNTLSTEWRLFLHGPQNVSIGFALYIVSALLVYLNVFRE